MALPGTLQKAGCDGNKKEIQSRIALGAVQFQFALTESHSHGDRAGGCMQPTLIVRADLLLSPCRWGLGGMLNSDSDNRVDCGPL